MAPGNCCDGFVPEAARVHLRPADKISPYLYAQPIREIKKGIKLGDTFG